MPIQINPTQFNNRAEEIHSFLQECIDFDMIIVGQLFDANINVYSQHRLIIEQTYLSSNKHDSGIKLDITPYTLNVLSKPKVLLELANTSKNIILNDNLLTKHLYQKNYFPTLANNLTLSSIKNDALLKPDFEEIIIFLYQYLQT